MGAFIGPHWKVRDSVALAFAQAFYQALAGGETLGGAAKAARQAAREAVPGNPGWLAYAVYGHPNARVLFGEETTLAATQDLASPIHSFPNKLEDSMDQDPKSDSPPKKTSSPSSNLRVKRRFTDRDRDQFVEESFDYIASFFESSLAELQQQHPNVETGHRRVDRNHFTVAIYVDGKKESSCRVWLDRGHLGDIAYASGDSGRDNTYNATLSAEDDGYSLFFRPGLRIFDSSQKAMTREEAAEYLWSMLIERLQ